MLISLTKNKFALIDDEDFDIVCSFKWNCSYYGYAVTSKGIKMHRLLLGLSKEDLSCVDHINGNTLDNRKCNLRICSESQNIANSKLSKSNLSGYKGVYWNKEKKKWSAQIKFHRKSRHIGHYNYPEDAARAYDKKAIELFGEFARTNVGMGLL